MSFEYAHYDSYKTFGRFVAASMYRLAQEQDERDKRHEQLLHLTVESPKLLWLAMKPIKDKVEKDFNEKDVDRKFMFDDFFHENDIEHLAKMIQGMNLYSNMIAGAQITQSRKKLNRAEFMLADQGISYKEQIEQLYNKQTITRKEFNLLSDLEKIKAFTIAGITSMEILTDSQLSLTQAIARGSTFKIWRDEMFNNFKEKGWELPAPYHLETIYRTNIFSSYMSGKARMISQYINYIAFLRYETMLDERVRETHLRMQGYTAPPKDKIWMQWFPPNGYNCRCDVTIIWGDNKNIKSIKPTKMKDVPAPDKDFDASPMQMEFYQSLNESAAKYGIKINMKRIKEILDELRSL